MNNFELIETVRARKPLWDKSTWEKVDIVAREELWNEVAVKMDAPKDIVKARWKNLRDSYRKIIRKLSQSDIADPKWPYFKAMEFLKEITLNIKPRSTDISLKKIGMQLEADYSLTMFSPSVEKEEESIDPLSFSDQINQQQSSLPSIKLENRGTKRQADEDLAANLLELETGCDNCETGEVTHMKQSAEKRIPPKAVVHDDDNYQFLLSLYPHLKQVPVKRKLMLRMKIEQLIYNELCIQSSSVETQTSNQSDANI